MWQSFLVVATLCLPVLAHAAETITPKAIIADPVFQKKSTTEKLQYLNELIATKKVTRPSLLSGLAIRLFWQELNGRRAIDDRLSTYKSLRTKYSALPTAYPLERTLAVQFLAEAKDMASADPIAKLKALRKLEEDHMLSWPALAAIYTGILTMHLAASPEFGPLDELGKIDYLKKLEKDSIIKPLTAADFVKSYAISYLANLDDQARKAALPGLLERAGTLSKTSIEASYQD